MLADAWTDHLDRLRDATHTSQMKSFLLPWRLLAGAALVTILTAIALAALLPTTYRCPNGFREVSANARCSASSCNPILSSCEGVVFFRDPVRQWNWPLRVGIVGGGLVMGLVLGGIALRQREHESTNLGQSSA